MVVEIESFSRDGERDARGRDDGVADALDFHFGAGEAGEVAPDAEGDEVGFHGRSVRV